MNDNTEADVGKISPEDIPTPQHSFEIAKKRIRNACPEDEHDWAELRSEDDGFYHWHKCRECGISDVTGSPSAKTLIPLTSKNGTMGDDPRDYDRHFTTSAGRNSHQRIGIDLNQGEVTRFLVQLEYLVDPIADDWEIVVRYDHDSEGSGEATHNVTKEGLHIDIYREGEETCHSRIDATNIAEPGA